MVEVDIDAAWSILYNVFPQEVLIFVWNPWTLVVLRMFIC